MLKLGIYNYVWNISIKKNFATKYFINFLNYLSPLFQIIIHIGMKIILLTRILIFQYRVEEGLVTEPHAIIQLHPWHCLQMWIRILRYGLQSLKPAEELHYLKRVSADIYQQLS